MTSIEHRSFGQWVGYKVKRARRHGSLAAWARHFIAVNTRQRLRVDYAADGLGTRGKNMAFLAEPAFASAWAESVRLNSEGWRGAPPNIAWRAHIACWAARQGLTIEGDFVECGVHTGLLSRTICQYLDFAIRPKAFWLFDTWSGIPTEGMTAGEQASAKTTNDRYYPTDVYSLATRNFAPYPNVRLVRGSLPGSLAEANLGAIAYLSIDLNNARSEAATIEWLWPKLSKGAIVLLDDYGFLGSADQHDMWDAFARSIGRTIVTLPTGQGMMMK